MTPEEWLLTVQAARLVLMGAVLQLILRAVLGLPGRPLDTATRLTTAGIGFVFIYLVGRVTTDLPLSDGARALGIRIQYIGVIGAIPAILSVLSAHGRPRALRDHLAFLACCLAVTALCLADGPLLGTRLVTRAGAFGISVVALEAGPLHPVFLALGVVSGAVGLRLTRRKKAPRGEDDDSDDDADVRLMTAIGVFVMVPAGVNDSLLYQGVLHSVPVLDLACLVTVCAYATVFARRARLAHGDAEERIRIQTEALRERTRATLEAERRVALGALAAGVGHELNNPLAVVTANVHALTSVLSRTANEVTSALEQDIDAAARACRAIRRALDELRPDSSRDRPSPPPSIVPGDTRKIRILIVDDEIAVARSLRRLLRTHDVSVAQSGLEALRLARAAPFDLVLCDVMMPGMMGPEVLDTLLGERLVDLPRFAFVTGGAFDREIAERVRRSGATVLEKPAAIESILELVSKAAEVAP